MIEKVSNFINNYDLIENKNRKKYPLDLTSAFAPITFLSTVSKLILKIEMNFGSL